jgi:hypothetical protein
MNENVSILFFSLKMAGILAIPPSIIQFRNIRKMIDGKILWNTGIKKARPIEQPIKICSWIFLRFLFIYPLVTTIQEVNSNESQQFIIAIPSI